MSLFLVAPDNQAVIPAVILISGGLDESQGKTEYVKWNDVMHTWLQQYRNIYFF